MIAGRQRPPISAIACSTFSAGDPAALDAVLAPGWRNHSSAGQAADRETFLGLVRGLGAAVPDLTWRVDEVIDAGDRIVVRGEGRGTPAAPLFGVAPTGRSFTVPSIDVHEIEDGRIARSWHLEDWAGAIAQLTTPEG
ncbi:MAG: ester cyclase [Thermoleophilia bacterium]|nr:ester cyclase [Thermoleophilia bacterium]